jgi:hypothetical protein
MKTATALTVLAIGAVFAFAITAHPSFLNLQVLGWVLILTGLAGLIIPRRGKGWLRRTVLVKGAPDVTDDVVDANARNARASLPPPQSTPTVVEGQVERESIVEYTEK